MKRRGYRTKRAFAQVPSVVPPVLAPDSAPEPEQLLICSVHRFKATFRHARCPYCAREERNAEYRRQRQETLGL